MRRWPSSLNSDALRAPMVWTRLILCLAASHFVLSSWSDLDLLWTTASVATPDDVAVDRPGIWLPLRWLIGTSESVPAELLAIAVVAAAILFALFGGRVLSVAFGLCVWSLHLRNPLLLDGGDNAIAIAVVLLPFTLQPPILSGDMSRYLSVAPIVKALHNSFVLVLMFQLAVIYATAGWWKVSSPVWRSGDALHVVLSVRTFNYPQWAFLVEASDSVFGDIGSWFAVGVQALAPIGIAIGAIRRYWVAAIVFMHLGIMFGLGLVTFALVLIGLDCLVLSLPRKSAMSSADGSLGLTEKIRRWTTAVTGVRLAGEMPLGLGSLRKVGEAPGRTASTTQPTVRGTR